MAGQPPVLRLQTTAPSTLGTELTGSVISLYQLPTIELWKAWSSIFGRAVGGSSRVVETLLGATDSAILPLCTALNLFLLKSISDYTDTFL